jgi:hypothetical protein
MSAMTRRGGPTRGFRRASRLSALIVALSFALQSLAFALSPNGRRAVATGADSATSTISEFCKATESHGGGRPDRFASHHHCAFCAADDRDTGVDGVCDGSAVTARLFATPLGGTRFLGAEPAPRPPGWISSWSSRAPPLLS